MGLTKVHYSTNQVSFNVLKQHNCNIGGTLTRGWILWPCNISLISIL